ncbi:MAG: putative DNA binding domain-containing protein [bacterium]|nr:putative DNA binding domain-containing protein [bacterium]
MFDSIQELSDKIALGESTYLELKEVRFSGKRVAGPSRDGLADELAAFANSRGGVLVMGVSDRTREVLGIDESRLDTVVDLVRQACTDCLDPPLVNVLVDRLRLSTASGKHVAVVKVEVPRSLFIHRSPGGYFHRLVDSKRRMSTDFLARMLQQRSQTRLIRFDEQPVAGANLESLSTVLCDSFRTTRSDADAVTFLEKLGIVASDDEGLRRPTVAGVLVACNEPRRWLPNAYIQAVAYHGGSIQAASGAEPYQLDASDIDGPVAFQIADACRFVFKNMKTSAVKSMGRQDKPQYDMAAVFEAVTNAIAHRDYSIHGSKIRLRLFDDRLELCSPGSVANSLSVDSLRYRQAARNETLCSLLAKCAVPGDDWLVTGRSHIMEKRGEGVPIILDNSKELSGREPQYRLIDDSELILTIYAADDTSPPAGSPASPT